MSTDMLYACFCTYSNVWIFSPMQDPPCHRMCDVSVKRTLSGLSPSDEADADLPDRGCLITSVQFACQTSAGNHALQGRSNMGQRNLPHSLLSLSCSMHCAGHNLVPLWFVPERNCSHLIYGNCPFNKVRGAPALASCEHVRSFGKGERKMMSPKLLLYLLFLL